MDADVREALYRMDRFATMSSTGYAADWATIRAHIEQLERIAANRLERCERMMQASQQSESRAVQAEARVRELEAALQEKSDPGDPAPQGIVPEGERR